MSKIVIGTPNYTAMMDSSVASRIAQIIAGLSKAGHEVAWAIPRRTFICKARHEIVWTAKELEADWLLWLDDDALPPKDIFQKLAAHDKDIVITPYPMRTEPYQCGVLNAKDGDLLNPYSYYNLAWEDMKKGLVEVDGGGTHCMLTKVSVYGEPMSEEEAAVWAKDEVAALGMYAARCPGKIPYPWFVLAPLGGTEDMYFCLTGRRLGMKIYCDTDVEAAHIGYPPTITSEDYFRCKEIPTKKLPEAFRSIDVPDAVNSAVTSISKNSTVAGADQADSTEQVTSA